MVVHHRVTPSIKLSSAQLYTAVERGTVRGSVLPKNTRQCPQPGLEPGPLNLESSALTMSPPCLPENVFSISCRILLLGNDEEELAFQKLNFQLS